MSRTLEGSILTKNGWMNGVLQIDHGRIAQISGAPIANDKAQLSERLILPGFIDLHVHGGGGADMMECADNDYFKITETIRKTHAKHGTTSLLATTMTAPMEDIKRVLSNIGKVCKENTKGGARILGVHLEGPFINAGKLGAQPPNACQAVLEKINHLRSLAPIRIITLAPEIGGHEEVIRALAKDNIRVQIGHTLGSYEEGKAALENGASGFTHLFNAMNGLHHREPGMVGAALAHGDYAELIPDLLHVHVGAIKTALRAIPHLYCVTDSTSAAGMPDGNYKLGSHTVTKCMGGVRLADGTLAGSALTMDLALRNLVSIGLTIEDASNRLSRYPAQYLGLTDRGTLCEGAFADIVVLDKNLQLTDVYLEGEVYVAHV